MVTKSLVYLTKKLGLQWKRPQSPYLVGMFHDLCKCDQYMQKADGTFDYRKNLPLVGHGSKSVIIAQHLLPLTEEEVLCIRWHMGAYDDKEVWNSLGAAIEDYPNVLFTHTADMMAARIFKT
jgi:HD superfamily phosphohydrolase YqeK